MDMGLLGDNTEASPILSVYLCVKASQHLDRTHIYVFCRMKN